MKRNFIVMKENLKNNSRIVWTNRTLAEVVALIKENEEATDKMQQAYLVEKPDYAIIKHKGGKGRPRTELLEVGRTLYLCVQEGAGSAYYKIDQTPRYDIDGPETQTMTNCFRYTGKSLNRRK